MTWLLCFRRNIYSKLRLAPFPLLYLSLNMGVIAIGIFLDPEALQVKAN